MLQRTKIDPEIFRLERIDFELTGGEGRYARVCTLPVLQRLPVVK
jgi:hypothetical protein